MTIKNVNNFKAKGTYLLEFKDNKGQITKPSIKKSNFVHTSFYRLITAENSTNIQPYYYIIYYGTVPNDFNYEFNDSLFSNNNPLITNLVKSDLPPGFNKYVLFNRFDDERKYFQIYSRFNSNGVERTFNYLMLCMTTWNAVNATAGRIGSSLILDSSITQEAYEDIDCYYNLETEMTGVFLKTRAAEMSFLSTSCGNFDNSFSALMTPSYCNLPRSILDDPINGYEFIDSVYGSTLPSSTTSEGQTLGVKSLLWESNPQNTNRNTILYGQILNTLFIGQNQIRPQLLKTFGTNAIMGHSEGFGAAFDWIKFTETLTEPFQSRFMKRAGSFKPYWEASENVSTRGRIEVQGEWQPQTRFPECYRINITKQGNVGEAEYQVWIKKFISISSGLILNNLHSINTDANNTWASSSLHSIPFLHPVYKQPRHHGSFMGYPKISCPWNKEEIIMFDRKGITILNLYDGNFRTWDSISSNVLNVTKIKQICFDLINNLIYIACKQNGLFTINYINSQVNHIVNEPCHAVDIGLNSKVFAIFEGRLSNSDNWNLSLPCLMKAVNDSTPIRFNSIDIPNSWSNILFIKLNPYSENYEMAIFISTGDGPARFTEYRISNTVEVNWWSINNTAETPCLINYISSAYIGNLSNPFMFPFWKNGNCWIFYHTHIFFGSVSSSNGLAGMWGFISVITSSARFFIKDAINTHENIITNKALDNLEWFGEYQEELYSGSYFIRFTSPWTQFDDYFIANGIIYTHINESNQLVSLDSSKIAITYSVNSFEYIQIEGDLYLRTVHNDYIFSFFNLFGAQYQQNRYNVIDNGWIEYGWNGSNWIKNHEGSKVTHNSIEKGPHNLDISFSNGTGSELVFEKGQYLLQFMCNGLMIDNTTSHKFKYNLYFLPTNLKVPIDPITLNSSQIYTYPHLLGFHQHRNVVRVYFPHSPLGTTPDPLFYVPMSSCKKEIEILINGVKAPLFYSNEKRYPDPGEVVFERNGIGQNMSDWSSLYISERWWLMFNPADIDKVVTGFYGYIKFVSP